MEYIQKIRVLYGDTDSYGVVWHGAYTKWFEAARVEAVEKSLGIDLPQLEANNILFPVVEMNIRYKSSAKINDRIIIKTKISEVKPLSVTFESTVYDKETNLIRVIAHVTVVVTDARTGKMYRRMPQELYDKFKNGLNKTTV